jgi:hypothetical protein
MPDEAMYTYENASPLAQVIDVTGLRTNMTYDAASRPEADEPIILFAPQEPKEPRP